MPPSFFKRLFSKALRDAAAAEARGDLEGAAGHYDDANEPEEACRVCLLFAETIEGWGPRVEALRRALSLAPVESAVRLECSRALAQALVAWVDRAGVDDRRDKRLLEEAAELFGALGEQEKRGDLLARVGRHERAAQAYALAGRVDLLDVAFDAEEKERTERDELQSLLGDFDAALDDGRFADAKRSIEEARATFPSDAAVKARAEAFDGRFPDGPQIVLDVEGFGRVTLLGEPELLIGRDPRVAQVVLRLPGISRAHARLTAFDGSLALHDVGAKNGLWLDDVPCQTRLPFVEAQGSLALGEHCTLRYRRLERGLLLKVVGAPTATLYVWGEGVSVEELQSVGVELNGASLELREGFWYISCDRLLRFDGCAQRSAVLLRGETLIEGADGLSVNVRCA